MIFLKKVPRKHLKVAHSAAQIITLKARIVTKYQPRRVLLVAGLLVVCLIAESMGQLIETGITDLGLPSSLAGVLVAMLILAPEALNAVQAASQGEVQRSINTLYGSVVATVSLTVPAVLVLGVITNTDVVLGLEPLSLIHI